MNSRALARRRANNTIGATTDGLVTTKGEKVAIFAMIAGGVAVIGGAVLFWRAARRRTQTLRDTLGRVQARVKQGGMTLTHHYDPEMPLQKRVGILQDLVWSGVQNPQMRELALAITGHGTRDVQVGKRRFRVKGASCPARDGLCEAEAVYNWTKANIRYTGDVAPVKLPGGEVEGVDLFQSALRTVEFGGEDCLPAGTLLLTDTYELTPIEQIKPGTKIWGKDRWTPVERVWYKGILPVDVITLNTGSTFKATADHKVYVGRCERHCGQDDGFGCSCDMEARTIERIPISDLRSGMVMLDPARIPFGQQSIHPDRALIEGLYLADGWSSHNSRFDIAGRDGKRKEAQKKLVEETCARLGVRTSWHEKHISVLDPEWALRVQQMGTRAADKHLLTLDLDEATAAATLQGLAADAAVRDCAFTSTSKTLALQFRLLHKMLGTRCGMRYIEDHGGLGDQPVWRGAPRRRDEEGWSSKKLLRVREIDREVICLPVYDITTEDHYVYLPEADVTVSNCDGHTIVTSTLLTLNGIPAKFRITAPSKNSDWAHIYGLAGLPKTRPAKWVPLDTTLPGNMFGREAPHAKHVDFVA